MILSRRINHSSVDSSECERREHRRRNMVTYHQLQTFLIVARTGNLTEAAREINATQPTVSLQLQALRTFLGGALFERTSSRFRLTPAGEKLRRYAEEAVGGLRVLQQEIAMLQGSVAGPLALGLTDSMMRYVLPSALSRFFEQFPGVETQMYVQFPERLFRELLRNTLDVACLVNVNRPPGLTVETLCEEDLVVFVSPRHPLARRRRVAPEDLMPQPFVTSASPSLRSLMDAKLRGAGVTPRVVAEAHHHEAIKRLVEHDGGYSIVVAPAVAPELLSGRLVRLRLAAPPLTVELVAVYRSNPGIPPITRTFIDFLRAELAKKKRDRGTSPR